jgi:DNA polymerase-3 subunit epsilon
MNKAIFFDKETTGFPVWGSPSGDPCQPHIINSAAIVVDLDTREELEVHEFFIKPDGWEVPEEITKITGITTDYLEEHGIQEVDMLNQFLKICDNGNEQRVAFNKAFDQRVVRIAIKRFLGDPVIEETWGQKDNFIDPMYMAKSIMKLPAKRGYKTPSLSEAYEFFIGKPLENAHKALPDTRALKEVYFAILDYSENSDDVQVTKQSEKPAASPDVDLSEVQVADPSSIPEDQLY